MPTASSGWRRRSRPNANWRHSVSGPCGKRARSGDGRVSQPAGGAGHLVEATGRRRPPTQEGTARPEHDAGGGPGSPADLGVDSPRTSAATSRTADGDTDPLWNSMVRKVYTMFICLYLLPEVAAWLATRRTADASSPPWRSWSNGSRLRRRWAVGGGCETAAGTRQPEPSSAPTCAWWSASPSATWGAASRSWT